MVVADLIFDLGMHVGRDSEFYLQKGFRVVAVEADPALVAKARERLASFERDGRLIIVESAICDHEGTITFYRNEQKDDWGSTSPEFAAQRERDFGTTIVSFQVPSVRPEQLFEQHGIPYYLKIDIEGSDVLCLEALRSVRERPTYVSAELQEDVAKGRAQLDLMAALGYRAFKVVNQAMNDTVRCPNPPLEGRYVDMQFDAYSSGPFGEEVPGDWMDLKRAHHVVQSTLRKQAMIYYGHGSRWHKLRADFLRRMRRRFGLERIGWYDLHATRR